MAAHEPRDSTRRGLQRSDRFKGAQGVAVRGAPMNLDSFSVSSALFFGLTIVLAVLSGRTPVIAAVSAWRLPKLALECAIEGSFRFVSDVSGDFRNASRCPFE